MGVAAGTSDTATGSPGLPARGGGPLGVVGVGIAKIG